MIIKQDIPLNLLKAIENIAQANLDIIKLKKEDISFYCFVELNNKSSNYFKIFIDGNKIIGNYDASKYAYEQKPADENQARNKVSQASLEDLKIEFENWTKLIREIKETPSVHDDNFCKYYSDFYFEEFKIVDEDAQIFPFNTEQQELIEIYLDSLVKSINSSSEKIDETVKSEIILNIEEIKNSLYKTTKVQVMKSITSIFGKLFTLSKSFGKEIVKEAGKELIKKLIENGIQYGPKLIEILSNSN
jgi:hypothetical protein